jgi:hypothetical protein
MPTRGAILVVDFSVSNHYQHPTDGLAIIQVMAILLRDSLPDIHR